MKNGEFCMDLFAHLLHLSEKFSVRDEKAGMAKVIVIFILALLAASPVAAARKVALIIGNAAYAEAADTLRNPPNDTVLMKQKFEASGFEVRSYTNLTRAGMSEALASFEHMATGADIGVIYYSGHGMEVGGTNYLLPVDAKLKVDRDVKYEAIALEDLLAALSRVSRLKLILLDACRDNPFAARMTRLATRNAASKGLARVDDLSADGSLLISYATAPGEVAYDGTGVNSPYTTALARHLFVPGAEIESALRSVAREVYDSTERKQRPYKSGSILETVSLSAGDPSPPRPPGDPCRDASAHWTEVRGLNDRTLIDDHIRLFPDCAFIGLARRRLDELAALTTTVTRSQEATECDRLAAAPFDEGKLASVAGVLFSAIDAPKAIEACRAAVALYPQEARLRFQLARSFDRSNQTQDAIATYRDAGDYPGALYNLGTLYWEARGTPRDDATAVSFFRRAADLGDAAAMNYIGLAYEYGRSVPKNDAEARRWYRRAAEGGDTDGLNNFGLVLDVGRGGPIDRNEALAWFRKAAAAGNIRAMYRIGMRYEDGIGVGKDDAEAYRWYRKSAEEGNDEGMNATGVFLEHGRGTTKDDVAAVGWYRKAAEKGHAQAMTNLGLALEFGRGAPMDKEQALTWYRKAADAGNSRAMFRVGNRYEYGVGIGQDDAEAYRWYKMSAEAGNEEGMYAAGFLVERGRGTTKDDGAALAWYRKAAEKGHGQSMNNVGYFYEKGRAVEKDFVQAAQWYTKGDALGNAYAIHNLAALQDDGRGTPRNSKEAARRMELAMRKGHEPALRQMKENSQNWSLEFRREMQQRLKDAGVYQGAVDGRFGQSTFSALDRIFGR